MARVPPAVFNPAIAGEVGRLRAMGEAMQGLVGRIEAYLRPIAQVGALIRRVEEGEARQRQILLLMERMVRNETRQKNEIGALAQALARIETHLDGRGAPAPPPAPDIAPPAAPVPPAATVPPAPRYDFAALQERAIANSRQAGQRDPAERRTLFGRRRSSA